MQRYENVLRSGLGFFQGSEHVNLKEWHQFVEVLQTKKYYTGFQGIGFSLMLQHEEIVPLQQRMLTEGYDSFTFKPVGERDQYSAILYLEPMDKRNIQAIGYDMFSDPTRREAMERARDTGLLSISKRVTLVQEIDSDVQSGVLMYLPLYKQGETIDTIEARQKALHGFVYSPFRMNDLMSYMVDPDALLDFEIYDSQEMIDDNLLYRSFQPSSHISKHHYWYTHQIGGRLWHIHFWSTPEFEIITANKYPLLFALGGLLVYFFLLFIILTLIKNRKVLERKTNELESNRSWLQTLLNSSTDGIYVLDIDAHLIQCNPSFLKMHGYSKKDVSKLDASDWNVQYSKTEITETIKSMPDMTHTIETKHRHKDGSLFDVEITAKPVMINEKRYIYASARDITERKKSEAEFRKLSYQNEAILSSVPDIIMQTDINKVYTWTNKAGTDFFGEDVIGTEASYYFIGEQDTYNIVNPLFEGDDNVIYVESWQKRHDGEKRLLAWWSRSLKDENGNVIGVLSAVQDITENKRVENELLKLSQAVEQSPHSIVITNLKGTIEYVNTTFVNVTGYTKSNAIGKNMRILQSGKTLPSTYQDMWDHVTNGESWTGEFINKRKDGTELIENLKVSPIFQEDGKISNYMASKEDITEKRRSEERIHYLANFDSLTGLPNRSQLEDRLTFSINFARRHNGKLAVLFLDLDQFKDINDTLGHSIGDLLLIELAKRFQSILREEDTVSRLGGDEFIFVIPHTDMEGISQVAQKILNIIAQPVTIDHNQLTVTGSIGIAVYPIDGTDPETLSKNADIAMYRAKQEGRNNYSFFTGAMQERSIRNLQLTNALHQALNENQFYLVYQPQISLHNNRVIGAEALLRWNHPELGNITPDEFIPLTEESGLILPIGEWVLRTAIKQAKSWIDHGLPPMIVAINLSAVQFRHTHLPDLITEILEEVGLPAKYLELELTEAVTMNDPPKAYAIMDNLYERGIHMSIDDFGTGYSSLSYLKKFKVYKLKIDRSFINDIHTDQEDKAIVSAIIRMAHSLGLKTIAEGVETLEQLNYLQTQGCDEIQGYYYSKPVSNEEFEIFVKSKRKLDLIQNFEI